MDVLSSPPQHRPDVAGFSSPLEVPTHDYDIDTRTGFMPSHPPLSRLPALWEVWETTLVQAMQRKLQLGAESMHSPEHVAQSESWRAQVRDLPILPTDALVSSDALLHRAHHVLAWILHFYVHTLPPYEPVRIPPPITVPLLQICSHLQSPPVLTYSDNVLYNWSFIHEPSGAECTPSPNNLQCQSLFTGTSDEEEFYLCAARIELRGVEALEIMRAIMDEIPLDDDIALERITRYLCEMARVIQDITELLLSIRGGCDPLVFYRDIRPWFRGASADPCRREWVFEGIETLPGCETPTELSGSSAAQSALVHALDIFLGISHSSPRRAAAVAQGTSSSSPSAAAVFLTRMQSYMPRRHRSFLKLLKAMPRPLRAFVLSANHPELLQAYNAAVTALKSFRDAHIRITALYILGHASRQRQAEGGSEGNHSQLVKGTGGSYLANFLKSVRDETAEAVIRCTSQGCG